MSQITFASEKIKMMKTIYSRIGVFFLGPAALLSFMMIFRADGIMVSKLFSGLALFATLGFLASISVREKC